MPVTRTILMLFVMALLAAGSPVGACDDDKRPSFSRKAQIEGRSWSVGGYTRREYKGRDSQGNRIGGTLETLPSGSFKFNGWSKQSPVPGRVQRFLERRR